MSAIGRGFALAPDAVAGGAAGRGKAYFIERLLREVLFAEAGLAGVNRRRELQKAALQLGIYAALVLIAIIGVIGMAVSYSRNKAYLADVGASLDLLGTVAMPTAQQTLPQMLPGLDALRNVSETANAYRGQWALSRHWGLYQGEAVGDEAREAYQRELNGSLLPKIGDDFKQQLQSAAAQPDKLYQYLKAYLMLGEPEHLDKTPARISDQSRLAGHLRGLSRNHALRWATTCAASSRTRSGCGRCRSMRRSSRRAATRVRQASIARLMYDQLKLIRADDTSHDLRLDVAAGIGADRVLLRKSGKKLSDPIPGLYTRAVFDQVSALGTLGARQAVLAGQLGHGRQRVRHAGLVAHGGRRHGRLRRRLHQDLGRHPRRRAGRAALEPRAGRRRARHPGRRRPRRCADCSRPSRRIPTWRNPPRAERRRQALRLRPRPS